jgi:hypothetical protein
MSLLSFAARTLAPLGAALRSGATPADAIAQTASLLPTGDRAIRAGLGQSERALLVPEADDGAGLGAAARRLAGELASA